MEEKLSNAAPYNFFLTKIQNKPAHDDPLTVTFEELFDPSLGKIKKSVQITYQVDFKWLLEKYDNVGLLNTDLLVIYHNGNEENVEFSKEGQRINRNVLSKDVGRMEIDFEKYRKKNKIFRFHHSKIMLFAYEDDSMRVIISTANLNKREWENATQGIWIGPKCEPLKDGNNGESETGFKESLISYLKSYDLSQLTDWIKLIKESNFSGVNVFFISSIPIEETTKEDWGLGRLNRLLSDHCPLNYAEDHTVIIQTEFIQEFEPSWYTWNNLEDFLKSIGETDPPKSNLKIIYGPLSNKSTQLQSEIRKYMHHWKSNSRHRTKPFPHIKTYCAYSKEGLHWFVLTSANFSKSAWGGYDENSPKADYYSNEAGVLFLPKFVLGDGNTTFPIQQFPFPFDIPPQPYVQQ